MDLRGELYQTLHASFFGFSNELHFADGQSSILEMSVTFFLPIGARIKEVNSPLPLPQMVVNQQGHCKVVSYVVKDSCPFLFLLAHGVTHDEVPKAMSKSIIVKDGDHSIPVLHNLLQSSLVVSLLGRVL